MPKNHVLNEAPINVRRRPALQLLRATSGAFGFVMIEIRNDGAGERNNSYARSQRRKSCFKSH